MKKCSRCGEKKPATEFWKRHGKPKSQCKDCERAGRKKYDRAYYERHRARVLARNYEWRAQNREWFREWGRERYAENPERHRRQSREWYAKNRTPELLARRAAATRQYQRENPDVVRRSSQRRRARKRNVIIGPPWERAEVFLAGYGICQLCGLELNPERWHEDHIVPLALGGPHSRTNVQPACPPCNQSKGDRLEFIYFMSKPMRPQLPPPPNR